MIVATFINTVNPTAFGIFDAEVEFQSDADKMVTFIYSRLGNPILSVELTKKQIWSAFEEATLEYSRHVSELRIKSELVNVLGVPTGSNYSNKYPHKSLEYLLRLAEPYSTAAHVGGSYNAELGYIQLENSRQDYDIYTELISVQNEPTPLFDTLATGSKGKMRIVEIFYPDPYVMQQSLLGSSNLTNFLVNNFNYESYSNTSILYLLPVFEDVLRRQMLEFAHRVRRSHYSWDLIGTKLRIYPMPIPQRGLERIYIKIMPRMDPLNPSFSGDENGGDDSINGVSGPHDAPFDIISYTSLTSPAKQWIRQFCLAICTEMLGRVRSKIKSIPIPNADLQLDGDSLLQQGRDDKEKLITQLRDWLMELTDEKLQEREANKAELLNKQLKYIPIPSGKAITIY
jgi:hypothetical protein